MLGRRQEINIQLQQLVDAVLLFGALVIAYWLRSHLAIIIWPQLPPVPPFSEFFWMVSVLCPFTPLFLEARGFYVHILEKRLTDSFRQLLGAGMWLAVMVAFCEIFLKWRVHSRAVMLLGIVIGVVFLLVREAMVRRTLRRRIALGYADKERVIVAGDERDVNAFLSKMPTEHLAEIEVVHTFDVTTEPVERLVEVLHQKAVSRVVFVVRHAFFNKIEEAVQACEVEGVEAWLEADFFQTALARPSFDVMAGKLMLVFRTAPQISWALLLKDLIDRVGALVLLMVTSPIWLAAVIGIKITSRGPVLFKQDRAGRHGRAFSMLKFRTMCVEAEAIQQDLSMKNQMSGPVFKLKDDPRVFRFGKWLRRLSIDELPQLINVLRGDMSLVGPRPLPMYEIARIEKHAQRRRLSVKPGLTCLWQVMGRNKISSFEEWVALDLKYIDNWSVWLDVKILCQTVPAVLRGAGAH